MGPGSVPGPSPALSARGIVKQFPGVIANDHVDVDVRRGEVHTLLGENGAGKSTLAAVMCGLYRPEAGELYVDGRARRPAQPAGRARARHRDGAPALPARRPLHRRREHRARRSPISRSCSTRARSKRVVTELGERFGLPIKPRARVEDLSVGERQRVEIVKTLYRGAEVLLLDEPTAVLTPQEVDALFETVRAMTAAGKAVVFISHKLGEVMEISDQVTVMRDGRVTGDVRVADTTREELARMMVGRDVDLSPRRATEAPVASVLELRELTLVEQGRALVDRRLDRNCSAGRSSVSPVWRATGSASWAS